MDNVFEIIGILSIIIVGVPVFIFCLWAIFGDHDHF
jgi:hypothetical protein